jgi:hypothetical protein
MINHHFLCCTEVQTNPAIDDSPQSKTDTVGELYTLGISFENKENKGKIENCKLP